MALFTWLKFLNKNYLTVFQRKSIQEANKRKKMFENPSLPSIYSIYFGKKLRRFLKFKELKTSFPLQE